MPSSPYYSASWLVSISLMEPGESKIEL